MLIDSHAHLDMQQFDGDREHVIHRALEAGVGEILNVGYDGATIDSTLRLVDEHGSIWAALGIHPHNAEDWDDALEEKLKQLLLRRKVLAVGEGKLHGRAGAQVESGINNAIAVDSQHRG